MEIGEDRAVLVNGCPDGFVLDYLRVLAVTGRRSRAAVSASISSRGGRSFEAAVDGENAVGAVSRAVSTALGIEARIMDLRTGSTWGRRDEAWVPVEYEGCRHTGYCASADLVEAVARAHLEALKVLLSRRPARETGGTRTKQRREQRSEL